MQVWFTAQDIADEAVLGKLPGLPTTKRGVNDLADRENWRRYHALARPRAGREGGGGYEYHLDILPLAARLTYVASHFRLVANDLILPPSDNGGLSERAHMARDTKLIIVRAADAFRRRTGLGSHAADEYFVSLFNNGSIGFEQWLEDNRKDLPARTIGLLQWIVRDLDEGNGGKRGRLSKRTIARWRSAAQGDSAALAYDPAAARKGGSLLATANDGVVGNFILGLLQQNPHYTAKSIQGLCRAEFGDEIVDRHGVTLPMPPIRTFQWFIKNLKAEQEVALTKMTNPDRYRSIFALSGTNAFAWVTEPNQLWQIDASPLDALCIDGRHSIYLCLDIATRRFVVTMSRTPRAAAVGLMTRKAILKWGAPTEIKTDNGSDFVAKQTTRLFSALGIEVKTSTAYTPQEKGHVERAIGTFQRGFCSNLPGFIGHDVTDRKEIESRKAFAERLGCSDEDAFAVSLTAAEVQERIDRWIELEYEPAEHKGLGGRSPAAVAQATATVTRRVDQHALDVLLMPIPSNNGIRVMGKKGLQIGREPKTGRNYYYQAPGIMPKTRVFVRMDPMDAGRVRAYTPDGSEFLAEAICYELAGLNPAEQVRIDRAARERKIAEITGPARAAVRHLTGTAPIDRLLAVRQIDADRRAAKLSNVIQMPRREENYTTPQLEAAAASLKPMQAAPQSERAAEIHAQLLADMKAPALRPANVTPINPVEESYGRFRRAKQLERLQASGQPLADQDARWLAGYREGPEYSALSLMPAGFAEAIGL